MSSEIEISTSSDQEPFPQETPSPEETLSEIVSRTRSLYSLPVVAVEVIQLTSNLQVDAHALKQCIEKDPALTAKILRVVNSSLFGLSREVSDLNQALALLGTKPLKLLVLGFSLPEGLFADVAREQLDWYWRTTLVRAVAAREISERLWNRPGDDAFLAGLLQDIGVLVLLDQLREPYAKFLGRVIEERGNLDAMEVKSLGFDHRTLSAELLRNWNMPELFVEAIAEKRDYQSLVQKETPAAELARVLHLAGLLAELVGQNRLHVLPELLEAGAAYCGFDKDRLHEIVPLLQDKVQQLAEVLSLDLPEWADYSQITVEAHAQMAEISEGIAARLSRPLSDEEKAFERMLDDAAQLRSAVSQFLRFPSSAPTPESSTGESTAPRNPTLPEATPAALALVAPDGTSLPETFAEKLTWAVGNCRSRRLPLSLLLVELKGADADDPYEKQLLNHILETVCHNVDADEKRVEILAERRWGLVLSGCDRQQAVRYAHELIREVDQTLQRYGVGDEAPTCVVSAGVASVTLPLKNFRPLDLVAAAQRCLAAAQSSGTSVVKSLEIF
ncbi:MAG: HDOD domain-containing protein [Planctomycetes bacterium]|nr:HDOD domain-containing protein [Planctomycetota bacterium]